MRGIGRWTVEMMLMFQLRRPDVLPVDDFGVRHGFRLAYGLRKMPRPKVLAMFGERWAPYRSVAAWYLWRAVDLLAPDSCRRRRSPNCRSCRASCRGELPRRLKRAAASSARPPRAGARTRARRPRARRSRAPAKKK